MHVQGFRFQMSLTVPGVRTHVEAGFLLFDSSCHCTAMLQQRATLSLHQTYPRAFGTAGRRRAATAATATAAARRLLRRQPPSPRESAQLGLAASAADVSSANASIHTVQDLWRLAQLAARLTAAADIPAGSDAAAVVLGPAAVVRGLLPDVLELSLHTAPAPAGPCSGSSNTGSSAAPSSSGSSPQPAVWGSVS